MCIFLDWLGLFFSLWKIRRDLSFTNQLFSVIAHDYIFQIGSAYRIIFFPEKTFHCLLNLMRRLILDCCKIGKKY